MTIDPTPIGDGNGPAGLLDMVVGRSTQVFAGWLSQRDKNWRHRLEVVAMDGLTGFDRQHLELPDAVAGDGTPSTPSASPARPSISRRRIEQDLHCNRGRKDDPLYAA